MKDKKLRAQYKKFVKKGKWLKLMILYYKMKTWNTLNFYNNKQNNNKIMITSLIKNNN